MKFQTTRGQEINLNPVSDTLIGMALTKIEKEFRDRGEPIDPPTYTAQLAGGAEETYPHDEKSVKGDPVAEKKWAEHKDAVARLEAVQTERRLRLLLTGLEFDIPDDGWQARHKMFGVEIPDKANDPEGYWYHYLTTEILVTPDDLLRAIEAVTKLTYKGALDEDAVTAAMESFRRTLRENSAKAITNRTRPVESLGENG